MNFLHNAHTVPLTDLLTLNLIIILIIVNFISKRYEMSPLLTFVLLALFIIASVIIHPMMDIPDNISRYFGYGEMPNGWRGM
jgi:hypothetical protein